MDLIEKKLSSEEIFDGVAIHLFRDEILRPNGNKGVREVVRHPGAVCVIPITDEGEVIFVNQFRYALDRVTLEVPAGKLEKGEDPLEAGKRELEEECGIVADKVISLGEIYPTVAYCSEIIRMYAATGLRKTSQRLDEGEFLGVEKIKFSDALKMVMNGDIRDAKTVAAILKLSVLKSEGKI